VKAALFCSINLLRIKKFENRSEMTELEDIDISELLSYPPEKKQNCFYIERKGDMIKNKII